MTAKRAVTARDGGVRIAVRAKPRASRSKVVAIGEDAVVIAIAAPPVDGAANQAIVELVAAVLGVPKRDVAVVVGTSSRTKVLEVEGVGEDEAAERLARAVTSS